SRAASHVVTRFMRVTDATPPALTLRRPAAQLTEVLTREELKKRLRKGCKPGDDILARLEPAGGEPAGDGACRLGIAVGVVVDDHAGHAGAVDQQGKVV